MVQLRRCGLLIGVALRLAGADPAPWNFTPLSQWTVQDAQVVLADSPWSKSVTPLYVRDLSPDERRQGGNLEADCCHGVGIAGTGILGPRRQAEAIARAHAHPEPPKTVIRWESALPIKAAERRIGDDRIPAWTKDYYAIAIFDFPLPQQMNSASQLKGVAFLKRDKRKDLKPKRVLILRSLDDRAVIVYLFSKKDEISKRDRSVGFQAQIGRQVVFQYFFPGEMLIAGELEL